MLTNEDSIDETPNDRQVMIIGQRVVPHMSYMSGISVSNSGSNGDITDITDFRDHKNGMNLKMNLSKFSIDLLIYLLIYLT